MIFAKGRRIKMSDEYRITQPVIERAFHQNDKIIFAAKIKAINLTTGKTFEFTSTALLKLKPENR